MTPHQHAIVRAVGQYWDQHGHAPSYDEIKDLIGIKSKGHLADNVKRLIESGHLRKLPGRHRSLEVVKTVCCPRCGEIFDPSQAKPRSDA